MKRDFWPLTLLILGVVGLTFIQSRRAGFSTSLSGPAPAWTLKDVNGQMVSSGQFSGRIVFLNFWATWCPPCRQEIPDFIKFTNANSTNSAVVVGVSLDSDVESVRSFAKHHSVNYPMLMGDSVAQEAFGGVESIPMTFVIDAQGNFAGRHIGVLSEAQLEKWVKQLQKTE